MGRQRGGSGKWSSSSPIWGRWSLAWCYFGANFWGTGGSQKATCSGPTPQSPHSWGASSACRSQLPAALGEADVVTGVGSKDIKASPEFKDVRG